MITTTMHYKSIADLSRDIVAGLHKLPRNVDLVVGIPRSGMLAASILALHLNVKFCDLTAFLENRPLVSGTTRSVNRTPILLPQDAARVLVVDDSYWSGAAMSSARSALAHLAATRELRFGVIYSAPGRSDELDFAFGTVAMPRVFEWNVFHRHELETFCVDIDGVLCRDPSDEENDDGDHYRRFLLNSEQLVHPSRAIGHLVTSRLEKYRSETERWLAARGIQYSNLHMLDLPTAAERRRLQRHASFKADVYRRLLNSRLFIESEPAQALEIARRAGKPVLDFSSQILVSPTAGLPLARDTALRGLAKLKRALVARSLGR